MRLQQAIADLCIYHCRCRYGTAAKTYLVEVCRPVAESGIERISFLFTKAGVTEIDVEFVVRRIEIVYLTVVPVLQEIGREVNLAQEMVRHIHAHAGGISVGIHFLCTIVRNIILHVLAMIQKRIRIGRSRSIGYIHIADEILPGRVIAQHINQYMAGDERRVT